MYHYYQVVGGQEAWHPVQAAVLAQTIEDTRPMFVTALAVNKLAEDLTPEAQDKLSYIGPLYIDWDGPNIDTVIPKVLAFIEKLKEMRLDLDAVRFYATGAKGFHCEIPFECFATKPPKDGVVNLPIIYKEMVYGLYVDTIDMRVYSRRRGRMWRQPNVERPNGAFKVQVSVAELEEMTAESYAVITSNPRPILPQGSPQFCADLAISFDRARQKVEERMKAKSKVKRDPQAKERAQCDSIMFMASGLGIKPSVGFHEIALQMAIIAVTAEWSEDRLIEECALLIANHQGNGVRYNSPPKRDAELRRLYRYADDNPMYDFSIGAIKSLLTHAAPDLDGIVAATEDIKEGIEEAAADAAVEGTDPKVPDEFSDVAGGVTLSKFGVYITDELGGKRRICAVSFSDIYLLVSMETGQHSAYEAMVLVNGRPMGRQTLELDTFQSLQIFNRFAQRLGHAMQGSETHVRGMFMRFVELAKKKGKVLYITNREGLDIVNVPHHEDPELREPFKVWADGRGVILDPRVRGKKGLEISFQGFPDPRGVFKTDLSDSPVLADWIEEPGNKDAMKATLTNMMTCQRADVISKMVGWYTACFYRMVFHKAYGKFPLLHVNGAAGAGKTEMNKTMASLFYYNQEPKMITPQSTVFAIGQHMSASTTAPLLLDEYKPAELHREVHNKLKLLLRDAYNARDVLKGGGSRESSDYRSLHQTQLVAPLVFIAEAAEEEAAISERVVLLTVVKPAASVSLKWLSRFHAWSRNKQHLSILGQHLATEVIETVTVESLQKEFDVIFQEAQDKYMLTEADLVRTDLDEATIAEKRGAKERSVYNFTVALFGLRKFRKLVDKIYGPSEFHTTFDALEAAVYTRMSDLQPATQAEWAKVLNAFASMSYSVDEDSAFSLRPGREYAIGQRNGRNVVEVALLPCYLRYRGYMRSTSTNPLFAGPTPFKHSIKDSPALLESGFGAILEQPDVFVFDTDELAKLGVGQFK